MIDSTLVHRYLKNVSEHPKQVIYRFIEGNNTQSQNLNESFTKASSIAKILLQNAKPGDRALLLYMPGIDFLDAFWACQLAGIIAVPAPLTPNLKQVANFIHQTSKKCDPAVLLTSESLLSSIDAFASSGGVLHPKKIIATDIVTTTKIEIDDFNLPNDETIALLQYTSGSVSQPKGVKISHLNLKSNLNIIMKNTKIEDMTNGFGWLPHFHDMGLIGQFLIPTVVPGVFNFMSPLSFVERPQSWLENLSKYKSEITVAPNFAFEYCNRKLDAEELIGLDLSNLEVVLTGSEPVEPDTLRTFAEKFESLNFNINAFMPCYGMAESTLMIACNKKQNLFKTKHFSKKALNENKIIEGKGEDAIELTSCGKADDSFTVKIVNTNKQAVKNEIGEIWLKGPSISKAYWNESKITNENFDAYLANGEGPYLKTGDLGCIIDGEIFITGRLKDIIIVRGKNYYPQDVENAVRKTNKNIKKGSVVAFGFKNNAEQETVAVCFEAKVTMAETEFNLTATNIINKVLDECGIKVETVCLANERQIPKTSSGKIQRAKAKKLWQNNELSLISAYNNNTKNKAYNIEATKQLIADEIALICGTEASNLDADKRIFDLGIDSIQLPELLDRLKNKTGSNISLEKFMNEPTINGLVNALHYNTLSNEELNTKKHIKKISKVNSTAAVILPDFNLIA